MSKTFKRICIFSVIGLAVIFLSGAGYVMYLRRMPFEPIADMVEPLWCRPALAEAGGDFVIRIKSGMPAEVDKAVIQNAAFPSDLEFSLRVKSVDFDKKSGVSSILVNVPKAAPEFLYDLSVWYHTEERGAMSESQPNAVKIRRPSQGPFTFAVVTGFDFRNDNQDQGGSLEKMRGFMRELNALNPDFVVVVDGVAENVWSANRDSQALYNTLVNTLYVPVFFVPNDFDTAKLTANGLLLRNGPVSWKKAFSNDRFAFDYRGFRFIGLNSSDCGGGLLGLADAGKPGQGCISDAEFKWLDYELTGAEKSGLKSAVFMHHEPTDGNWTDNRGLSVRIFDEKSRQRLLGLCAAHGAAALFSGLPQRDSVSWSVDTLLATTGEGTSLTYADRPALRLITIIDGRIDERYVSYIRDPNSVPLGKFSQVFRGRNDGSAKENTLILSNGLERPLNNVSAVARMAKKPGGADYAVSVPEDGTVTVTQTQGRSAQYVFINADMLAFEKKVIEIR